MLDLIRNSIIDITAQAIVDLDQQRQYRGVQRRFIKLVESKVTQINTELSKQRDPQGRANEMRRNLNDEAAAIIDAIHEHSKSRKRR